MGAELDALWGSGGGVGIIRPEECSLLEPTGKRRCCCSHDAIWPRRRRHRCETRHTFLSRPRNNPTSVFFFFLLSATSYVAMSSLLDVEVEGITGQLAIGTYMSVEPSLNACSDSVATLATATLEPGRLSLPDSNSLRKSRQ